MLPPINQIIEVPCDQAAAYATFLAMETWWPMHKFSVSALRGGTAKGLRVQPELGGEIVELGHDGTEHLWGTFTVLDPPNRFQMDFHIAEPQSSASQVELRFTALAPDRTQVELTQFNWEAFGKKAKMMYGGYAKGWAEIFAIAYKAACGAQ